MSTTKDKLRGVERDLDRIREQRMRDGETSGITSLDDLSIGRENEREERSGRSTSRVRIDEARQHRVQMTADLQRICQGLETGLVELGEDVQDAYNFQGTEKLLALLGKLGSKQALAAAKQRRVERLGRLDIREAIDYMMELARRTIEDLGIVEKQYDVDIRAYENSITRALEKLRESQPALEDAKRDREKLSAERDLLKRELESGTISESERPRKEAELERLEREHQTVYRKEIELLEILRNAQEAIPELQKNRDAADSAARAIRQMRRGLLEKMENFKSILENSMTSVRALAKLETYRAIDPAINRTVTSVTESNIRVAGAAAALAMERAQQAVIDPERSAELLQQLSSDINEFLEGFERLEKDASAGPRRGLGKPSKE